MFSSQPEQRPIAQRTPGTDQSKPILLPIPINFQFQVYYLKSKTRVGRSGDPSDPDIQLSGVGIHPEHCVITLENGQLTLEPIPGARTCVNGAEVKTTTRLRNGDRILWGSNHFFRVNCPKNSSTAHKLQSFDRRKTIQCESNVFCKLNFRQKR